MTFLVGENGCGKSTLLEIIALALRLTGLTQQDLDRHPLMNDVRDAVGSFRFVRGVAPKIGRRRRRHGLFFRADDVTGFLQSVQQNIHEHEQMAAEFAKQLDGGGLSRALAATQGSANALADSYGEDMFGKSHGEIFLSLIKQRLTAPGLYLFDEPETPLSPVNQIALLLLLQDAAQRGSQLIVATHSPILMALPQADILDLNVSPPAYTSWEQVDHVFVTRSFLNEPGRFLKHVESESP